MAARPKLHFAPENRSFLEPYLPNSAAREPDGTKSVKELGNGENAAADLHRPFVTLTFATSLDSTLSLAPGVRTAISGSESEAMTHYLRARHDAILVGVGTAVADNPSLSCRLADSGKEGPDGLIRPVIVDPRGRWDISPETTKVLQLVPLGLTKAPWIVTCVSPEPAKEKMLRSLGGAYIVLSEDRRREEGGIQWKDIFHALHQRGVTSVMVEGGGKVINTLLSPSHAELVDSVIVTIAPTWLGRGGVVVCPPRVQSTLPVARLVKPRWQQLGDDVVLCGLLG